MRQRLLLKSLFLLCALIGGVLGAWAQATVGTVLWSEDFSGYSANAVPSGEITDSHTGTTVYGGFTISYACEGSGTKVYYDASGPNASSNDQNLLIAKSNGTFSVSGIPTGGASELTLSYGKVGSGTLSVSSPTTGVTISGSTITTNGASSLQLTFKNTNGSKNLRIDDIVVTVKTAGSGGGSSLTESDLALTGAPVALSFNLNNNSSAQVVTYTTSSTGAITITPASPTDYFSYEHDADNKTITVTPLAVTPSAQTITVSQVADDTYDGGSVTFTVSVSPTHTATFSVNGATTTQNFVEGADITFPENPASIDGKVFMGWVRDAIDGTQTGAPSFVTSATMGNSDVTFYAVFAEQSGSGDPVWAETDLSNMTASDIFVFASSDGIALPNDGGMNLPVATNTITVENGVITSTVAKNLKWNVSGNTTDGYIFYPNGDKNNWLYCSTTASSSSNDNIKIGSGNRKNWVFDSNGYLKTNDDYTARYLSIYNKQDFRGYVNTTNGAFVPKFYKYTSSISYSNYCTTVVAPSVARPEITIAENPFFFSTTATITCDTEGATIYYRYTENDEWAEYTGALTITETTTIYAKAIKNNEESSVASVTATKNLAEPTVTVSGDLTLDLNGEPTVSAGTLTATVTYNDAAVEGAAVIWSSSAPAVASIDETTGAVTLLTTGEVTFTATFSATSDYAKATGTKTVTVVNSKQPGTVARPYTVAEARAAIDAGTGTTGVYATGVVSGIVEAYNTQYGNISYNISVDGETTGDQLQAFRGKSYGGESFTSADDIQVGDVVVIYGNLKKYNSTYEFDKDNQLVSLQRPETPAAPTFSLEEGTYTSAQSVEISCTTDGATIYYSINNSEASEYTGPITLDPGLYYQGKYTIKAYAKKGFRSSEEISATYTINLERQVIVDPSNIVLGIEGGSDELAVTYINFPDHQSHTAGFHYWKYNGTNAWKNLDDNIPAWFHIEYSKDRRTLTYTIDENTTSEARDIEVDFWIQNTFSNRIYFRQEAKHFPIQVTPTLVEATAEGESGTINVTYDENITNDVAEVVFCNAEGEDATYDWITAEINATTKSLDYTIVANTGEARTAYLKVRAKDDQSNDAYSELITITQAEYVIDYATLPFVYDDNGKGTLPDGFTVYGLDSYNNSPKMQFNSTGDWAILKFNEAPGTLSFDIKGNSFSGGTFKVQTSEDGETYTDLETYTVLGATQSEEFDNLGQNVRYIKWSYTKKDNGNVALGNIQLAKYVAKYTLTYSQPEHGTIIVKNGDIPVNSGDMFEAETSLNITAEAAEGYSFQTWTANAGTFHDNNATTTFTMPAEDVTLSATFTLNTNTLIVTNAVEHGTVNVTVNGEAWNGSDEVPFGATVVLTATPENNWNFTTWSTTDITLDNETQNPLTFTMPDKVVAITANYEDATLAEPELTLSPAELNLKVNDLGNITVTTLSDGVITLTSSDENHLMADNSDNNKQISIYADVAGTYTLTVSQAASTGYKAAEAEVTINVTKKSTTLTISDELIGDLDIYTIDNENMLDAMVMYNNEAVDGATVSWTSSDPGVATINDGMITLVKAGTTTITATYEGDDEYESSEATYELTVVDSTPYVQATTAVVDFDNEFIGVEEKKSLAARSTFKKTTDDKIEVEIISGSSNGTRGDATYIRLYTGAKLSFSAPQNYSITKIVLTRSTESSNVWSDPTANVGSYTDNNKTWTGDESSVTFNFSGTSWLDKATITLAPVVSISSAGLATYACDHDLDFTNVKGVKAYKAKVTGSNINFEMVTVVPAGEGVLLRSMETLDETKTFTVPVAAEEVTAWEESDNDFVRGTGEAVPSVEEGDFTYHNYILNRGSQGLGFYQANNQMVATDRAYIQVLVNEIQPVGSRLSIVFTDEVVTDITEMRNESLGTRNDVYDLQGRKVDTSIMKKGLYIVRSGKNGRKVVK